MDDTLVTAAEQLGIDAFIARVAEMFERSDYLLPLAAGQRQFRQDSYQMASAAQLEDLFFDTFGMFLRENHPANKLERRSGSELWDYKFDGLAISHKETLSRGIAVWWTAGNSIAGKWHPKEDKTSYSSSCPIVLIYSGRESAPWRGDVIVDDALMGEPTPRAGALLGSLGTLAIANRSGGMGQHSLVLGSHAGSNEIRIENVWGPGSWQEMTFHDFWPALGGEGLSQRDLWIDQATKGQGKGLAAIADAAVGMMIQLPQDHVMPGVYVISTEQLVDVPLVANNRAHSLAPEWVRSAMVDARNHGRYLPLPLWFAHFASSAPPNLYVQQRSQYEALFAARQRLP